MKTQTTSLSLVDTKQVTGGRDYTSFRSFRSFPTETVWRIRERSYITQALRETGGRFNIL